jgi:FLVCR family MFS transporter
VSFIITSLSMEETLLDAHPSKPKFAVSVVRWWCLIVCSALASVQGGIWNNFGPISASVEPFFDWDDASIALLSNWGPIGYFVAILPTVWLLDVQGLRTSVVVGSLLAFAGSVLRVLHLRPDRTGSLLMHGGQALNGLAGPVAMSMPPVLSASWFPPGERTIATAIVTAVNYGGCAATFVLGPAIVPPADTAGMEHQLWLYMMGELVATGSVFVCALVLFPARPPLAPSRSAAVERSSMGRGLSQLLRGQHTFWCLTICYGVVSGFFSAWGSMLGLVPVSCLQQRALSSRRLRSKLSSAGPNMQAALAHANLTHSTDVLAREAGMMGCWGAIAGMVGGVALGFCADRIARRKKTLLIGCCAVGGLAFFLFSLVCAQVIPLGARWLLPTLYATSIIGSLAINATYPLFYEMAVEAVYPCAFRVPHVPHPPREVARSPPLPAVCVWG